jgi:hypothetical protein
MKGVLAFLTVSLFGFEISWTGLVLKKDVLSRIKRDSLSYQNTGKDVNNCEQNGPFDKNLLSAKKKLTWDVI